MGRQQRPLQQRRLERGRAGHRSDGTDLAFPARISTTRWYAPGVAQNDPENVSDFERKISRSAVRSESPSPQKRVAVVVCLRFAALDSTVAPRGSGRSPGPPAIRKWKERKETSVAPEIGNSPSGGACCGIVHD